MLRAETAIGALDDSVVMVRDDLSAEIVRSIAVDGVLTDSLHSVRSMLFFEATRAMEAEDELADNVNGLQTQLNTEILRNMDAEVALVDSVYDLRSDLDMLGAQAVLTNSTQTIVGSTTFVQPIVGELNGVAQEADALTAGPKTILGELSVQDNAVVQLDLQLGAALYFGDRATDGTWRVRIDGDFLLFERREAGVWVIKSTIDPN